MQDLNEKVAETIRKSVKAQIETTVFISQVREGKEFTKEELMEELSKIDEIKKMIRECEHKSVALPLEREEWDKLERELWGLVLERL